MDLIRLGEIMDYQRQYPPLHQMVAVYLGVDTGSKKEVIEENEDLLDFLSNNGIKEAPFNSPRMM